MIQPRSRTIVNLGVYLGISHDETTRNESDYYAD